MTAAVRAKNQQNTKSNEKQNKKTEEKETSSGTFCRMYATTIVVVVSEMGHDHNFKLHRFSCLEFQEKGIKF